MEEESQDTQAEQVKQARESSLLALYAEGRKLQPSQLDEIAHLLPSKGSPKIVVGGKRGKQTELLPRQARFVALVAKGWSHTKAYRHAYNQFKKTNEDAGEKAWRITKHPLVFAALDELKRRSQAKSLLSINERLKICAECSQDKNATWGERMSGVQTYTKIAGDQSPERQEISGPNGGPIAVADTSMPATRLSVKAKVGVFRQKREAKANE